MHGRILGFLELDAPPSGRLSVTRRQCRESGSAWLLETVVSWVSLGVELTMKQIKGH